MHIIYVDDERPARDNFRLTVANILEISSLTMFQDGEEALEWAKDHMIDMAFLDMEMPGIHGLALAQELKKINSNIRVVFVTAYNQYAMDAWGVDAIGYILKPYTAADIRKELGKCQYKPLPSQHVVIQTIPQFSVTVDGVPLHISGTKPREMLALLVDRGSHGLTTGEGIAYLWPDKPNDANAQSLFRVTYKRLVDALEDVGIGDIITTKESRRFLRVDQVECDLYRILSSDKQEALKYDGRYMEEYSWAENRNGQLYHMLHS